MTKKRRSLRHQRAYMSEKRATPELLSSDFGCAIGLVSGIATIAAIVLSIFSFATCYDYGFMLMFSQNRDLLQ